jgi:hypothetical protein
MANLTSVQGFVAGLADLWAVAVPADGLDKLLCGRDKRQPLPSRRER